MPPQDLNDQLTRYGLHSRDRYHDAAFARNIGLFSQQEQDALARATVAIPGMGGVGGLHLVTLARSGIGRFHLADFDTFEPVNVNRQYGARVPDFGKPKLDVMIQEALGINPYLEIKPFDKGIDTANLDGFLDGVQVVLDGLDFFQFDIRRQLFNRAREKGIYVVTAGPMGFSAAVLIFSPHEGMSFDEYFNVVDGMTAEEHYLAFGMGLAPRATHIRYMDLGSVDLSARTGPSLNIACQICAGMAATEAVRILLKRPGVKAVPYFSQFDPYRQRYRRGKLFFGNRNPIQKLKMKGAKWLLARNKPVYMRTAPDLPDDASRPDRITAEKLNYIIAAGIQAPSGDNAQPWKFACGDTTIDLYLDRSADHSFFNVRQIASIISCGAVIENMRIAASATGLGEQIDYLPGGDAATHMAQLRFHAAAPPAPADPLIEWLWKRNTNRTFYKTAPVSESLLDLLERVVSEFPGAHLHLVTDRSRLRDLAKLVYQVDRIRTEYRPLHEHLGQMIRFTDAEAEEKKDGLPLKNLEAGMAGELFLKATRPWPVMQAANRVGLGRMVAVHAMIGMMRASGAALLTVDGMTPRDFLNGGQALERIWLTLNKKGLCLQPMTAITLFRMRWLLEGGQGFTRRHQKLLAPVWGKYAQLFPKVDWDNHGQVMLFRFGHGQPIKYGTHRKALESFMVG